MANIKYFAGDLELRNVRCVGTGTKASHFIGLPEGVEAFFIPGQGWIGGFVAADRRVTYKSYPSRHECDARCMNATGRTMQCECACGGRNHGKGALVCAGA